MMLNPEQAYKDIYATCAMTYASLWLRHDSRHPDEVTEALGLTPRRLGIVGETRRQNRGVWHERADRGYPVRPNRSSHWAVSSEDEVESRDALRHIDWVLALLNKKDAAFATLLADGWEPVMSVFWHSNSGHGGPVTTVPTLARLAALGIPLSFDFYDSDHEEEGSEKE